MISRRERDQGVEHGVGAHDGGAHKCTLCYDRLQDGIEPACAKACPTDSIQFGPLDELVAKARERCEQLVEAGVDSARLYGDDPNDGVGGFGAFFLLLDDPEVYGLPPDPVVTTRDLGEIWGAAAAAAALLGGALLGAFALGRPMSEREHRSYYGRPILKEPVWKPEIPWYLFTGGLGGALSGLAFGARLAGNDTLARRATLLAGAASAVNPVLLVKDLGRPRRFLNMLRVFKVTSPMSVGSWLVAAFGTTSGIAAGCELLGILPRTRALAEGSAAGLGLGMSTYTGALLADTSIPVWHDARRELPFVFGSGAAMTAGAAAAIATPAREAGPARAPRADRRGR